MSKKKILDLKKSAEKLEINLKRPYKLLDDIPETAKILNFRKKNRKTRHSLDKQNTPIQKIQDIDYKQKDHYFYIRGKKYTPPKSLGNILKIAISGFLILIIINILNVYYIGKKLSENISAEAYEGYSFLKEGGKNATRIEFNNALNSFQKALKNFSEAENDLWFISTDKSIYAKSNNFGYAIDALLVSGKHFSIAGEYFLSAVEEFNKIPLYFVSKNQNIEQNSPSITDTIKIGLENVNLAVAEISLATEKINEIKVETLAPEIKNRIIFAQKKINEISDTLTSTQEHFPALLKLLGDRYPHRYLILLQNNNEIRPSGGFIGSYIIMDINDGYIEKLETHDVYDIDGSYGGFIEPPEDLKNFLPNWRFRDSNYSADFPTSASKARWFLEKEGGPNVDTVIAINQGLLNDMLEITGPIQVGNFGKLNSENYNLLLSYIIEGKIWGPEDPKHILKIFVPVFKEAILKEKNISKVASKIYKAIQQKHILFYSSDSDIQALFDSLRISGRIYHNNQDEDYLSVINFSTGGTKSEQFIEENIIHETFIDKNGNLTDEINIKRTHKWDDKTYFKWKKTLQQYGFKEMPDELIDILGRGENKVYTKIYVPAGSILVSSNGSDVVTKYDADLKKTYFLTTIAIKAGENKVLKIKYRLPYIMDLNEAGAIYKLIVEKQPGSRGSVFTKTVQADEGVKNIDFYPADARINNNNIVIYATNLVYDRYFSGIWAKE